MEKQTAKERGAGTTCPGASMIGFVVRLHMEYIIFSDQEIVFQI